MACVQSGYERLRDWSDNTKGGPPPFTSYNCCTRPIIAALTLPYHSLGIEPGYRRPSPALIH